MANKKRIADEWKRFEKDVIPRTAPDIQRKEMRRAFYAGVWATLQAAKKLADESVDEDAAIEQLEAMQNECVEFMKRVGVDY